jgi:GNAT superfamily N-acetyltransferase
VIDWRFRDDGICFTATKSGKFVGFLWLHDHPYQEDEVNCLFAPMPQHLAVWDYDVYVEPEVRAGRAFVRLWSAAHDYLRERGVRWTMSRISAFNPGSLGAHERMGARRVGSAFFLCLGSFQVASLTTGPRLHFSRVGGRPPVARIPVPDAALDAEAHACPPRGVGASGPSAQIEAVRDGEGR